MCSLFSARAQQVQTTYARPSAERESNFLYEVKIIDEFIERFNDDLTSNLRKTYLQKGQDITFSRPDLLRSLFEPPAAMETPTAKKFIAQVNDSAHPQHISFNDTAWYAEVQCSFLSGGHKLVIPLILQVNTAADKTCKWMISGIGDSPELHERTNMPDTIAKTNKSPAQEFISPSDYATNFLELHRILAAHVISASYFVPELMATERGKKFVQLIQSDKLTFEYPGTMKFYFFQIPNYAFVVERFVRNTPHSGWLISSLAPATDAEKNGQKSQLLQRIL